MSRFKMSWKKLRGWKKMLIIFIAVGIYLNIGHVFAHHGLVAMFHPKSVQAKILLPTSPLFPTDEWPFGKNTPHISKYFSAHGTLEGFRHSSEGMGRYYLLVVLWPIFIVGAYFICALTWIAFLMVKILHGAFWLFCFFYSGDMLKYSGVIP